MQTNIKSSRHIPCIICTTEPYDKHFSVSLYDVITHQKVCLATQNSAKYAVLYVISAGSQWSDAIRAGEMLHLDFLHHPNPSGSS